MEGGARTLGPLGARPQRGRAIPLTAVCRRPPDFFRCPPLSGRRQNRTCPGKRGRCFCLSRDNTHLCGCTAIREAKVDTEGVWSFLPPFWWAAGLPFRAGLGLGPPVPVSSRAAGCGLRFSKAGACTSAIQQELSEVNSASFVLLAMCIGMTQIFG